MKPRINTSLPKLPNEVALYTKCIAFHIQKGNQEASTKLVSILHKDLDWDIFLKIIDVHPLHPQLYDVVKHFPDLVPTDILNTLQQKVQAIKYKNLMHVEELKQILEAFQNAGIIAMPYKGVALAQELYGDVAKRYTNDLDIVIAKSDYELAKQILHSKGYVGGFDGDYKLSKQDEKYILKNRHHIAFKHHQELWYIELHWQWFPERIDFQFDYEEILPRLSKTSTIGANNYLAFSPKDLFLVLNIHAAEHYCMSFKWLYDSFAFLDQYSEISIEDLCSHAAKHNARDLVVRNLFLLHHFFEVEIPQYILKEVENSRKQQKIIRNVVKQFSTWPMSTFNEWQKIKYGTNLADGLNLSYKLNYLKHVVFLEDQGSYSLPTFLHPIYPLVRPFRIVRKMLLRNKA